MKKILTPHSLALFLVLAFVLLANATSFAQFEEFLDQVVVSARGYQTPLEEVPGGIEVATQEDLLDSPQHGSLADALDKLPGIARTGESPYAQDVSIRGLSGTSIVILVDGKRINTATDMNARLGYVNPLDVERIEVLKGPITSLYGSGSLGGVINIITRKPQDFTESPEIHGRLSLIGSTNPLGGAAYAYLEMSSSNLMGQMSVGFRDYNSVYGADSQKVVNSQFRDYFGRASFSVRPTKSLTFTTEFMKSIVLNAGVPGGNNAMPQIARITYPRGEFMMVSEKMELSLNGILKKIEAEVYYTTNRRRVRIDQVGPQTPQPIDLWPQADHDTLGGKLSFTVETERHTLVAGADFWTWNLDSTRTRTIRVGTNYITTQDKPTPKSDQLSMGIFFSDSFSLNQDWTFYFGGRLDRLRTTNEDFFFVNPATAAKTLLFNAGKNKDTGYQLHLGASFKINQNWNTSLMASMGYRAADLMERFKYISLGGGEALYGEPTLKPERSIFLEYTLDFNSEPFLARLSLFSNIIRDYVAEKRESPTIIRLHNVRSARIFGAEVSLDWRLGYGISLYGNLTSIYGQDREKNQPLPGIQPLKALVGLEYHNSSPFFFKVNQSIIGKQSRTPEGVEPSEAAYITDILVGFNIAGRVTHRATLSFNNIFDNRYHNYLAHERGLSILEPGVSVQLGYTLEF